MTIHLPHVNRARYCHELHPDENVPCTRSPGHTGRHHFHWCHCDGTLRYVWEA